VLHTLFDFTYTMFCGVHLDDINPEHDILENKDADTANQ
jgi:hypothetical protein